MYPYYINFQKGLITTQDIVKFPAYTTHVKYVASVLCVLWFVYTVNESKHTGFSILISRIGLVSRLIFYRTKAYFFNSHWSKWERNTAESSTAVPYVNSLPETDNQQVEKINYTIIVVLSS